MQKRFSFVFTCAALTLLLFSSCQKDLGFKPAEVEGTPLPGQTTYCRIESIWQNPGRPEQQFLLVLYDEFENPIAITAPSPSLSNPYHEFKYDSWHRLIDYRGYNNIGTTLFTHRYGYDNSGRIALDTTFAYGTPENHLWILIHKYEYDNQNRISRVTDLTDPGGPGSVVNYLYNESGNLIAPVPHNYTYDNKVSMLRTNDIWMFLARDYSVNNGFIANAYNAQGYPTIIKYGARYLTLGSTGVFLNDAQIGYSCRPAYW